jgi:DNA polymerase-3 subunit epsilon
VPERVTPARPAAALRRVHWRRAPFVALDFETTGLDYAKDDVVSFGLVPVRGGRVVVGEGLHELVAPGVPPSSASMRIHQILPRELELAQSSADARRTLREALDRRFLLAWYADVELAFLRKTFGGRARTWRRRTVDVLRLAMALEGADPEARYGLTATAQRYRVPVASPHEAFDDALVTAQLFLVLASRLEARGFGSVRSYLRLTRPAGTS